MCGRESITWAGVPWRYATIYALTRAREGPVPQHPYPHGALFALHIAWIGFEKKGYRKLCKRYRPTEDYHPCRIHSSRSRDDRTRSVYSQSSPRASATSRWIPTPSAGAPFPPPPGKFFTPRGRPRPRPTPQFSKTNEKRRAGAKRRERG